MAKVIKSGSVSQKNKIKLIHFGRKLRTRNLTTKVALFEQTSKKCVSSIFLSFFLNPKSAIWDILNITTVTETTTTTTTTTTVTTTTTTQPKIQNFKKTITDFIRQSVYHTNAPKKYDSEINFRLFLP